MSGMFQRIARRHPNDSDEPVAPEVVGEPPATAPAPAAPDGPTPAANGPAPADPAASAPTSGDDAPTERFEPVTPSVELPTGVQPAVSPSEQPTAHQPSAPPPALDLTTRIPLAQAPAPTQPTPSAAEPPATVAAPEEAARRRPGFRARGRLRRRLRYLRRLRELQVRDLGGLVFDLRRFERKRDDLVAQKVDQIRACDDELRALETALDERRDLRDVREPGIGGTCPRCFAVFGSADKFCANCGAALGGAVQGPAQVPLAPPPPASAPPVTPPEPGSAAAGPQQ